jgi:hypothetical protein
MKARGLVRCLLVGLAACLAGCDRAATGGDGGTAASDSDDGAVVITAEDASGPFEAGPLPPEDDPDAPAPAPDDEPSREEAVPEPPPPDGRDLPRGVDGPLPERPSNLWDVSLIQGTRYTRPHAPAMRTSADGRVAVQIIGTGVGARFHLLAPERLATDFARSPAGPAMLANEVPLRVTAAQLFDLDDRPGSGQHLGHLTVCDPTTQFPTAETRASPYVCGEGNRDDCYDLTVLGSQEFDAGPDRLFLVAAKVRVRVTAPKTAAARIAEVRVLERLRGPEQPFRRFLEPMVTQDGRLLVMRTGRSSFSWRNEAEGDRPVSGVFNVVYSVNSGTPCDPRGWVRWRPIAHAQYDLAVNGRGTARGYGFALQHWRDASGGRIPDGIDLPISYPWIDREGSNLFFFTSNELLFNPVTSTRDPDDVRARYRTRCVEGVPCIAAPTARQLASFEDATAQTRGLGVLGIWTNWKMVVLDGMLNNTDYGLGNWPAAHRMIELYQGSEGWVRVGTGRGNDRSQPVAPPAFTDNTEFVDAFENLFAHLGTMRPRSPRDLVWLMRSGKVSEELAFDDYLSQHAMIVAGMEVGLQTAGAGRDYRFIVRDGYVTHDSAPPGFRAAVYLQNAATSFPARFGFAPPAHGYLTGPARVEPVALGGIHGRGLWLRSGSGLRFPIAGNTPAGLPWYAGVFLDVRFADDGVPREVFSFPDGSALLLVGHGVIRLRGPTGSGLTRDIPVPPPLRPEYSRWTHLAVLATNGGRTVQVLVDGLELAAVSLPAPAFRVTAGNVWLGASQRPGVLGARGWFDEFKLLAERPVDEVLCNHARGTLVALTEATSPAWQARAEAFPAPVHARIAAALRAAPGGRYACLVDYAREGGASSREVPASMRSLRDALLAPEGPLTHARPRPDASGNPFCLSCHGEGRFLGLRLSALTPSPGVPMRDDPRRQPSQSLRVIYGTTTPESLAPSTLREVLRPDRRGTLIDPFLHP